MTITDAMVTEALVIAGRCIPAGSRDWGTFIIHPPTRESMRAALEAVAPAIRKAALEEAEAAVYDCRITCYDDTDRWYQDGVFDALEAIRALADKEGT